MKLILQNQKNLKKCHWVTSEEPQFAVDEPIVKSAWVLLAIGKISDDKLGAKYEEDRKSVV